jgi:conjugal transfer pilus assembly protein TraV
MSGLDGKSEFGCKAPEGVSCSSLSGVYANAVANNLPALKDRLLFERDKEKNKEKKEAEPYDAKSEIIIGEAPSSGDPIRSQPKIMRIWIAPWEDSEGDLHDQSYIYVVADYGRWKIEHSKQKIINEYQPKLFKTNNQTQPQQDKDSGD